MEQKDPSRLVLPSNSISKPKPEEVKPPVIKLKQVASHGVKVKKKGFVKRLATKILADDAQNIKTFIVSDTIIPAIRNLIYDMATGALDMSLFGGNGGPRRRDKNKTRSYVSYQGYYTGDRRDRVSDRREQTKSRSNMNDIVFESRGEAEEVLTSMIDVIEEYGQVTVANLYELVGMTGEFTDNRYGWTNLASAKVNRVRDGYIIDLPRPVVLD